jgi:hypothetical protein
MYPEISACWDIGEPIVWVGILGKQLLGPDVWPNRPTDAVYRPFLCVRDFLNDNICGSCMIGHHLMFSAL